MAKKVSSWGNGEDDCGGNRMNKIFWAAIVLIYVGLGLVVFLPSPYGSLPFFGALAFYLVSIPNMIEEDKRE